MCGIVYVHNRLGDPVNNDVLQQFDMQRSRGTQGFGLFDGEYGNLVRHSKEDGILKWLVKYPSNIILFHHRLPTSTINVKRAAHPFSTKDYFGKTQYILVHNGSVRNARTLFGDHQELGIEYQSLLEDMTFNDSEALLWDFALTIEGKQDALKAYGAIAFTCLKLVDGKLERLYFGRNTNPLNMLRSKHNIMLSSEGAGEAIEKDTLYNYNYKTNRLTNRYFKVPLFHPSYKAPEYEYTGGYSDGRFPGESSFTPGSYAARGTKYPSIQDCDCHHYGWMGCTYHGQFYSDDDERWANQGRSHDGLDYARDEANAEAEDDSAAYASWWKDHSDDAKDGSAGDWLPPKVRARFEQFLRGADKAKKARQPDYEYDEQTQLILPAGTKPLGKAIPAEVVSDVGRNATPLGEALAKHARRKSAEQLYVIQKKLAPSKEEVLKEMLLYLTGVHGHFEMAYIAVEIDYERAEAAPDTKKNIRRRYLLEKVMERMQNDEDYVNENSISTLWQDTWQKQKAL